MALYRTYRPATFADVVGQEHVTDPLSRALDSGRINHAYLFSGPRGCGKTSSARILARSLNCAEGPTSRPCGTCSSCVALAPGGPGNLDVIELDAASHGGVDDTRELRDRAFYAPAESRYRVFIVDEAHMVTNAGFNALLKIVEEPPEHLIFVFATTEPEKVLPTIRSRTHHYPFRLLAPPVMRGLLEKICEREGVTVAPEVYPLVIRAGGGSPRDSLSILDQLLAGADDQGVAYERALALLGVTDIALIDTAVDALASADGAALFGAVEKVVDAGHDPRRFAVDLLERLRDLILLQAVPDAADRGLVEAPGDQLARMQSQIETLGPASLTRFAEIVHDALGEMRGTTSPRLLLEVMCARMLLPAVSNDDAALLQRLERLESGIGTTSIPVPVKPAEPEPEPKFVRPSQRKAMEEAKAAEEARRAAAEEAEADVAVVAPTPPAPMPTPTAPEPVAPEPVAPAPEPVAATPMVEESVSGESVVADPAALMAEVEDTTDDADMLEELSVEEPALDALPDPDALDLGDLESADTEAPDTEAPDIEAPHTEAPDAQAPTLDLPVATVESPVEGEATAPPAPEPVRTDRTPSVRNGGTPTAPEPPVRAPAAEPATKPAPEPGQSVHFDDIPLPDEPVDEYSVPPPDAMPIRAKAPEPKPEPEPEPARSGGLDADEVRKRYPEIRAAVRERSKSLEPMLSAAVIADLEGTTVVLGHPVEVLVGRLSAPHAVTIIREALSEVFGTPLDVRTVHQAPGTAVAPSAAGGGQPTKPQAKPRQSYSRPSRARDQSVATAPAPEPVAEPEEPEPPRADEDIPDEERAEMVADARTGAPEQRLDPDLVALELLKSELGARPIE
ncbi:DNA polymerase III subunit gamma and tau [Gordonia amicalis]|uniref:DNA polymerase III subunit gamma and tau n=1 Tax=Gordonia amicalis TaxID=89053 RepID=UPI0022B2BD4D|nr:DNA polymerase III subunit gamma and tau [Gordonia amicalis]MCZ4579513.1 DNA polymerase III subunit gamma and tau [Gordonia amicalis]MCZ4654241.1 DNA polymerase III subunit gamma and tau [Gordonia amicalis]